MRKTNLAGFIFGILLSQILANASIAQTPNNKLNDSQQVVENQIMAFHQHAHEKAFSYAAPALQVFFRDVDNFVRMVKRGYNPIYNARNWAFGRSRSDGKKSFHEVLIAGPNGKEWVALSSLEKQKNGEWKIISVQLLESRAKST